MTIKMSDSDSRKIDRKRGQVKVERETSIVWIICHCPPAWLRSLRIKTVHTLLIFNCYPSKGEYEVQHFQQIRGSRRDNGEGNIKKALLLAVNGITQIGMAVVNRNHLMIEISCG